MAYGVSNKEVARSTAEAPDVRQEAHHYGGVRVTDTESALTGDAVVPSTTPATDGETRLRGVAGWLLFFCVSLTVLNPVSSVILLTIGFIGNAPYFIQFPGLLVLTVIDTVVSLALMSASVYAGVGLWRVRPGAVRIARMFLIAGAVYALLAPFTPLLAGLPAEANGALIQAGLQGAARGVLYYVIWLNYLNRSKRVLATYPVQGPSA
jgi:uncharacterized protein DUF2569